LLRHLLRSGRKGKARLLAADVLEEPRGLAPGLRSRFIGMAADQGFSKSARIGFHRYFDPETLHDDDLHDSPNSARDGLLVPWMGLRLISLFDSISRSPRRLSQTPDAFAFVTRVATICFPDGQNPRSETHAALAARALFILAGSPHATAEQATAYRKRAIDGIRQVLFAANPRRVPSTRTTNILLHEVARHCLRHARMNLERMRRDDVGPDGVSLSSVALAGAGDVLSVPRYGGLVMLTDIGKRAILRRALDGERGHGRKIDVPGRRALQVLRGNPDLRRWWRGRMVARAKGLNPK
jgi:hypothetical protein